MSSSIIIIGAGASGLQAGRRLLEAGYRVVFLEAAAEPGGRILGLTPRGFSGPVEGGAEFIHGELPLSLAIAREAGVELQPLHARMMRVRGSGDEEGESGKDEGLKDESGEPGQGGSGSGREKEGEAQDESGSGRDWGVLMRTMGALKEDM